MIRRTQIAKFFFLVFLGIPTIPMAISPARAIAVGLNGYKVSVFAFDFANSGVPAGSGPVGIASDAMGNLYVGDIVSENVYKLGPVPPPGGWDVATLTPCVSESTLGVGSRPHGMTFDHGRLYLNLAGKGETVEIDPSCGTNVRVVATGLGWASGIAANPFTDDLFVDQSGLGNTIWRIQNPASGTPIVSSYVNEPNADGLAFRPDGALYAVAPSKGVVELVGTPYPTETVIAMPQGGIDGMATSLDLNMPFVYTNDNDGTIQRINVNSQTVTQVVTGGSRGDFATVSIDDCMYATQSDSVLLVTNANNPKCAPPPLGPLFQAHPSVRMDAFTSNGVSITEGGSVPVGTSVHANASVTGVSGGPTPMGNLNYTFFNNGLCSPPGTSETVTLSAGVAPNSMSHILSAIASYSFQANYTGDNNYPTSTSTCVSFSAGGSNVATSLFDSNGGPVPIGSSVTLGTSVHDSAVINAAGTIAPTGTLTYTFFANSLCNGPLTTQTVTLSNGVSPNSDSHTPKAGFYSFRAAYSGDSNYIGSASTCEPFQISGQGGGGSVGGTIVPLDKIALLAPYIGAALVTSAIAIPTFFLMRVRGRKRPKISSNNRRNQ